MIQIDKIARPVQIALICPGSPAERVGRQAGISNPQITISTAWALTAHNPRLRELGQWLGCMMLGHLFIFSEKKALKIVNR